MIEDKTMVEKYKCELALNDATAIRRERRSLKKIVKISQRLRGTVLFLLFYPNLS